MKHILYFAVATIAIGLMTLAAHAQRSDLDLRVHVPFPFQCRGQHVRSWRLYGHPARAFETHIFNQENRAAASVSVLPASSHN